MNKEFEVLVWNHPPDDEGLLGEYDKVITFDVKDEAINCFNNTECCVKILMRYESNEPDADGEVLMEEW